MSSHPSRRVALTFLAHPDDAQSHQLQVAYRSGQMVAPALPEREALQGVVADFCRAVRGGPAPATDGRSGLRVLELLEAARQSLSQGGRFVSVREEVSAA